MTVAGERKWSSELLFIAVSIGTAIGINTVWRFTYLAGENGGGAFVLIFLLAQFLIAVPALIAEYAIGRMGAASAVQTMDRLRQSQSISVNWRRFGIMGTLAVFLILSFYCVIAGWTFDYFVQALMGKFQNISIEQSSAGFDSLMASPARLILFQAIFIAAAGYFVARGVNKGVEAALGWMTSGLLVILFLLFLYVVIESEFLAAAKFMFLPDLSKVTLHTVTVAFGHAFFSLGVGVGVMLTLGAYMSKSYSIGKASMVVGGANAIVSIVAGLTIFPITIQYGLSPAEGPGLLFKSLPVAFGQMTGGYLFATLFFLLLGFAGLTSAITLIESIIAVLEDFTRYSRKVLVLATCFAIWVVGLLTVFSFNIWQDFHPLSGAPILTSANPFQIIDYVASNIMMPLGGILICILAAWALTPHSIREEVNFKSPAIHSVWFFTIRFIVPLAVLFLFIANI
ncbi:sodium-dependent transporter [Govanella unica]|uniref:Sodium-dependent transporter n=1 Tax=Govanella unica TaxID=2975056 RepID=A0A9X3TYZ1_9PROT|nr:sodium-dependent transporter [Govania unica]MDA5194213.1 sodium-dependent transporter [Govania unica]